ncbi:MAG: hypothetical protein EBT43_05915 [Methylocystaceae bacterium]|nr:hypothetical protein [Methylocystaceae bacterium]
MSELKTTIIKHPSSIVDNLTLNADGTVDFYSPQSGGAAPGAVMYYAMKTPPSGWLICDGSSHPTATYPALHAAIGNTYGGDAINFNLPDLRGQFIRGWDDEKGIDPGRVFGSKQEDGVGPIIVNDPGHDHLAGSYKAGLGNQGSNYNVPSLDRTSTDKTNISISGTIDETRPVNVALLPCIKT